MGGSPLGILRLTAEGASRASDWLNGTEVPTTGAGAALADRLIERGIAHPRWESATLTSADVTVVVPVKDDPDGVRATLGALGDVGACIVVDDHSAKPLDDSIFDAAQLSNTQIIRRKVSGGPGMARTTGLAEVTTPIVAFVDADVEPQAGWLEPLLCLFNDPAVAGAAPQVSSRPGPWLIELWEHLHSPLDLGHEPARVAPRARVSYVPTACLLLRADAVRDVGGFDPALRYGEDVDLVWRLIDAGHTIRYEPGAVVRHRARPSWRALSEQRRSYGTAAAPLAERHPNQVPPLIASWWSVAAIALTATGHWILGLGLGAFGTRSLVPKLESLPEPKKRALSISLWGNRAVAEQMASATTRTWWPVALLGALVSRRIRMAVGLAVAVPSLTSWWRSERTIKPLTWIALRLFDDMSYGAGVWQGCIDHKTIEPLLPDLRDWRP